MDPTATLQLIEEAATFDAALPHIHDLETWLMELGAAQPRWEDFPLGTRRYRERSHAHTLHGIGIGSCSGCDALQRERSAEYDRHINDANERRERERVAEVDRILGLARELERRHMDAAGARSDGMTLRPERATLIAAVLLAEELREVSRWLDKLDDRLLAIANQMER